MPSHGGCNLETKMINGAHIVLYTKDPEADRAFFRDVLQLPSIDAGHGWLIFALPPAEAAFHGVKKESVEKESAEKTSVEDETVDIDKDENDAARNDCHELYFMCDDLAATLRDLKKKNVPVSAVSEQRWGSLATLTLPSGGKVGIYEPKHPRPRQPKR
jgi:catechol 2,3-dioxygenase-like lactoylglutathione lyase family enzyme